MNHLPLLLSFLLLPACGDKAEDTGGDAVGGEDGGDEGGGDEGGGDEGGGDEGGDDPVDADGDGVTEESDCDDADDTVFPGADEVCDDKDNDCDGDIDEEPVDGTISYADTDGDGFGDPEAAALSCELPEGHVSDDTDCGDDSAWVYPGAPEICDGRQTDCDDNAWTSDAGAAHFLAEGGSEWVDMAATLLPGGSEAVTAVTLDEPGTLHICAGTWPVALTVSADLTVVGADGADEVVLTGLDSATVVVVQTAGVSARFEDLTLADGLSTQPMPVRPEWYTLGGSVSCAVESELAFERVVFSGGLCADSSCYGDVVGLYHCDAALDDVTLTPGELRSGVVDVLGGSLSITDTTVSDITLAKSLVTMRGPSTLTVSGLTLKDVDVTGSKSPFFLGSLSDEEGGPAASFEDSSFESIDLGGYGVLYLSSPGSSATIDECTFTDLVGDEGTVATLDSDDSSLVVSNTTVSGCVGGYSAGIVNYYGTLEVVDSSFTDMEAEDGTALYQDGELLTLSGVSFDDIRATETWSGAVYYYQGEIVATDVSFTDGSPADVVHYPNKVLYDWGTAASFSCDSEGCE